MAPPSGFTWERHGDGTVVILHRSKEAVRLRDRAAEDFLAEIDVADEGEAQHVMARATGNYRRGNERTAKNHPRNR
jgi:hypothetical protein